MIAEKQVWSFAEFEAMSDDQFNAFLAEIPSDSESIADDFLSGDEDDVNPTAQEPYNHIFLEQNDLNNDSSPPEIDSDDEPLASIAERLRASRPSQLSPVMWSKQSFYQEPAVFDSESSGVHMEETIERPVDVFLCLFPEDLIDSIVFHTNLYATQKNVSDGNKSFQPTTHEEMKLFLGVNILMGVKKLPSLKDYWSAQYEIRDTYISKVIPRDRFYWLLANLHFADNSLQPKKGEENYNKLYKLGPLLTTLSRTYKEFYKPGQFQAVDESMIKYKGRSCMKQYMPAKPTKRGYKVWVRADDSGFVCEFQIYTGKIGDLPEKDLGRRVVKDLTRELRNKNHSFF